MNIPQETKVFEKDDNLLTCPICNFDYVHIINTEKIKGLDSYKAWKGRGNCFKINIFCENNHFYSVCLGEHKGRVFSYWEPWKEGQKDFDNYGALPISNPLKTILNKIINYIWRKRHGHKANSGNISRF